MTETKQGCAITKELAFAGINFTAKGCAIGLRADVEAPTGPCISMGLALAADEEVELAEEQQESRPLKGAEWSLSLYRGPAKGEMLEKRKAIGILSHHPASEDDFRRYPESVFAWAYIDPETFDILRQFVLLGRVPDSISIQTNGGGLGYGWHPDGTLKLWSPVKDEPPAITSLSMSLGTSGAEDEADETRGRVTAEEERWRATVAGAVTEVLREPLARIEGWWRWLAVEAGALVVLLAILVWR